MRMLITGAGGPSAVSVWKSLNAIHDLHMADMDPCAAGLYLVRESQRLIVPRGDDPRLIPRLLDACRERGIALLIPTVDAELRAVALARDRFAAIGTRVAVSSAASLELCRDKHALLTRLADVVPIPESIPLTSAAREDVRAFPRFVKPRMSAGSRGAERIDDAAALAALPLDGSYLLQQYLPGAEHSVDVYRTAAGRILAAVPRERLRIDSGIAIAARTVIDPELCELAMRAVAAADITYVANVQFKRDQHGAHRLLEINPRFPGTLPLTHAAGVDLPALLVAEFSNDALPAERLPYRVTMSVRYLTEVAVDIDEWERECRRAISG